MMKKFMLNKWLIPFRETGNPIYAWRAFFNARRLGFPIPEDVLKYLDGVAHEITKVANNPPKKAEKRNAELARALGMQKDTTGQGSVFTNYSKDLKNRQIAIDAFLEIEKQQSEDEAFWTVGEKHGNISAATVRRIYKKYMKIWEAQVAAMFQSGQGVGPLRPDGKRLLNLTFVESAGYDLGEKSVILSIIHSRFHELP